MVMVLAAGMLGALGAAMGVLVLDLPILAGLALWSASGPAGALAALLLAARRPAAAPEPALARPA